MFKKKPHLTTISLSDVTVHELRDVTLKPPKLLKPEAPPARKKGQRFEIEHDKYLISTFAQTSYVTITSMAKLLDTRPATIYRRLRYLMPDEDDFWSDPITRWQLMGIIGRNRRGGFICRFCHKGQFGDIPGVSAHFWQKHLPPVRPESDVLAEGRDRYFRKRASALVALKKLPALLKKQVSLFEELYRNCLKGEPWEDTYDAIDRISNEVSALEKTELESATGSREYADYLKTKDEVQKAQVVFMKKMEKMEKLEKEKQSKQMEDEVRTEILREWNVKYSPDKH